MAGQEDLTELHFFGIPTAYFDLFPKGIPVVIRTVVGTSVFCFLHPDVADLCLRRITYNEFALLLPSEARITDDAIQELVLMLVRTEQAYFPVTIRQVTEALGAVGEVVTQSQEVAVSVVQKDTSERVTVQTTDRRTSLVQEEIEVEIV